MLQNPNKVKYVTKFTKLKISAEVRSLQIRIKDNSGLKKAFRNSKVKAIPQNPQIVNPHPNQTQKANEKYFMG